MNAGLLALNSARVDERSNAAEREFTIQARARGWIVTKRGWPDFIATKDGRVIAVEVKPTARGKGKFEQQFVMQWLASHGIETYLWNPESGFLRINGP